MTAKTSLKEVDINLSPVDYGPLLKEITAAVKKRADLFSIGQNSLEVSIDAIAMEVVQKLAAKDFQGYLPFTPSRNLTFSSVMFEDGTKFNAFGDTIHRLKEELKKQLAHEIAQKKPDMNPSSYLASLLQDVNSFNATKCEGLDYPLSQPLHLTRKHIHLRAKAATGDRLRGHKMTVSVKNLKGFDTDLIGGLCNVMDDICVGASQVEKDKVVHVLQRRISDPNSSLGRLKQVLWKESLGRLYKEGSLVYLDYIIDAMKQNNFEHEQGYTFLRVLSKRLRLLDTFLTGLQANGEERPRDYYQVSYHGFGANYCDLLSNSDAYYVLPIIPEVEGGLGESYDKEVGEQSFVAGVKFKLNGHVQTYPSAFNYYLDILDPQSKLHRERQTSVNFSRQRFAELVLKVALVYGFVFSKMDDEDYDPSTYMDKYLLDVLRSTDDQSEQAKSEKLHQFAELLRAPKYQANLKTMRDLIVMFLRKSSVKFDADPRSFHLNIDESIIDEDEQRILLEKEFFVADVVQDKGKNALKYMRIEDASAGGSALATLPVTIDVAPIYYAPSDEKTQKFSMRYEQRYHRVLPIMLFPNTETEKHACQDYYQKYCCIVFLYQHQQPFKAGSSKSFVYQFAYMLLQYICLKMMVDEVKPLLGQNKALFVPLIRIHLHPKAKKEGLPTSESDVFLRSMAQSVAHVLGEECLTNTQGFYIGVLKKEPGWESRLENGLASLYAVLPKAFTLDVPLNLDRLAIIVVSSRKSDAHRDSLMCLSTIYGETITLQRNSSGFVHVTTLSKFASNEDSDTMYQRPTVIIEEAKKCYMRGYRHIFYIAQAPYSSNLHISTTKKPEEQFFMSKDIIQALKNDQKDLNIYPMYSDKHYVVKLVNENEQASRTMESMYIDDTKELRRLFDDPNQSSIVFFNLLNGFAISKESVYNGVVSYATLINIYDDPIYDQMIRNHLIDDTKEGSLKNDFLNFLTLFHFSRYEKKENINFKLDPYENIIGSDAVGKTALISHMYNAGVQFNMLAFLAAVRSVLNKRYSGYLSTLFELPEEDSIAGAGDETSDDTSQSEEA